MCGWYHQMWEKNKETTECDRSIVTCDVGIAQYENGTIKCEKKIKVKLNVRKIRLKVMLVLLNVTIELSIARKKDWTTKRDKSTITCDFDTAQFEDSAIKC